MIFRLTEIVPVPTTSVVFSVESPNVDDIVDRQMNIKFEWIFNNDLICRNLQQFILQTTHYDTHQLTIIAMKSILRNGPLRRSLWTEAFRLKRNPLGQPSPITHPHLLAPGERMRENLWKGEREQSFCLF
jgi:hypothetical protein